MHAFLFPPPRRDGDRDRDSLRPFAARSRSLDLNERGATVRVCGEHRVERCDRCDVNFLEGNDARRRARDAIATSRDGGGSNANVYELDECLTPIRVCVPHGDDVCEACGVDFRDANRDARAKRDLSIEPYGSNVTKWLEYSNA
jgi:hypothetical protein